MTELAAGSVIKLAETTGTGRASVYATVKRVVPEVAQSLKTWQVTLQTKLGLGLRLSRTVTVESQEFDLNISGPTSGAYEKLSMNPGHPRYFASVINNDPNGLVYALPVEPPNTTAVPFNRPKEITTANAKSLVDGKSEDQSAIGASDYENALLALTRIDDVNIVAAPGVIAGGVQQALITHCESMKDRFAVLDSPRAAGISGPGSVAEHRPSVDSASGYAALYYPWLRVSPAVGNVPLLCFLLPAMWPGSMRESTTIEASTRRPPGTEATLNGVLGVEKLLSDTEQGDLNMTYGINVMRVFQAGGRPDRLGRAHDRDRHELAVRQHPPPVPLPRGVDPGRHPLGGVRAEQPRALAEAQAHDHRVPGALARRRAVRRDGRRTRSTSASTRR